MSISTLIFTILAIFGACLSTYAIALYVDSNIEIAEKIKKNKF